MKKLVVAVVLTLVSFGAFAADNGLITKKSQYSVSETLDRMERALKEKGIAIALRWNHSERANQAGIPLRPTELLMFGNPKLGSHFFTSQQTAGIDLPMKVLAYEDEQGQVWLTYNDPQYIAARHGITDRDDIAAQMSKALDNFSNVATGKQ